MPQTALPEFVAVGVWADGREICACHGVTSVDNPLPVAPSTTPWN